MENLTAKESEKDGEPDERGLIDNVDHLLESSLANEDAQREPLLLHGLGLSPVRH